MAGRRTGGLGKGLDALIPNKAGGPSKEPAKKTRSAVVKKDKPTEKDSPAAERLVKISSVEPNLNQPRRHFDEDALLFDTLQSHTVTLMSRASGRGVEVSWENFPYLGVWTPAGKRAPFVCLEPWCGAGIFKDEGDAFDARRCVQRLEPFTSGHHRMVIRPI